MGDCKYGDPTCPCQDGDPCHYEGPRPFNVPPEYVRRVRSTLESRLREAERRAEDAQKCLRDTLKLQVAGLREALELSADRLDQMTGNPEWAKSARQALASSTPSPLLAYVEAGKLDPEDQ